MGRYDALAHGRQGADFQPEQGGSMKRYLTLSLLVLLCSASQIALARPNKSQDNKDRIIPVLVHVNAKGKVTEASPAYKLRPSFVNLLKKTINSMITKPAMDHHGKPIASQFVMTLGLTMTQQDNGKYQASFKYISSKSLPSGDWFWTQTDSHRLTLADRTAINPIRAFPKPSEITIKNDAIRRQMSQGR
jgi:hypothetical protein